MKEKPNTDVVEDAEELRKWRCSNQSDMDLCWMKLAERTEEEVLDKHKVEEKQGRGFQRWRCLLRMEDGTRQHEIQNMEVERRLLVKKFLVFWRIQLAASAKQAGGVNRRRRDEAAAKNGDYERSDKENQINKRKNGR